MKKQNTSPETDRFVDLARKLVAIPKIEVDKRIAQDRKEKASKSAPKSNALRLLRVNKKIPYPPMLAIPLQLRQWTGIHERNHKFGDRDVNSILDLFLRSVVMCFLYLR